MWPPSLTNPPSHAGLADDLVERFGRELLMLIQIPLRGDDIDRERQQLASRMVELAAGDRDAVERLASYFIRRLHRAQPDLAGVAALRVSEQALRLMPR